MPSCPARDTSRAEPARSQGSPCGAVCGRSPQGDARPRRDGLEHRAACVPCGRPAVRESVAVALRAEGGGPFKAGRAGGDQLPALGAGPSRHGGAAPRVGFPRYPHPSIPASSHPRPGSPTPPGSCTYPPRGFSVPSLSPLCPLPALGGAPRSLSAGCGCHSPGLIPPAGPWRNLPAGGSAFYPFYYF